MHKHVIGPTAVFPERSYHGKSGPAYEAVAADRAAYEAARAGSDRLRSRFLNLLARTAPVEDRPAWARMAEAWRVGRENT